jgi:hypothetical protein
MMEALKVAMVAMVAAMVVAMVVVAMVVLMGVARAMAVVLVAMVVVAMAVVAATVVAIVVQATVAVVVGAMRRAPQADQAQGTGAEAAGGVRLPVEDTLGTAALIATENPDAIAARRSTAS